MQRGWLAYGGYLAVLVALSLVLASAQDDYFAKVAMGAGIGVTLAVSATPRLRITPVASPRSPPARRAAGRGPP